MLVLDLLSAFGLRGVLIVIFFVLLILYLTRCKDPPNFPPGPRHLPFIGNIFNIEPKQPHIYLTKGTKILPMLHSVLFDKTQWEAPDTFNPGHFLDKDGKFMKRDTLLPFSAGKRVCLGEGLANMELFLFIVGLLQKFSFFVPDGVELRTDGITGATHVPHPFQAHAKVR